MNSGESNSYRWVVLGISWLCIFTLSIGWYSMPTLQSSLMILYNINITQFNLAFTLPFLIAGILSIPGGILADSWGVRKTVSLAMVFGGIGFLGRALLGNYVVLLVSMASVGTAWGLLFPNAPKMISAWFPPEETALSSGIFTTGMFIGLSIGMAASPYFPEWIITTSIMGIMVLILCGIFFILAKDAPPGKELKSIKLIEGVQTAIKSKTIWLAGFGGFLAFGGMVSFMSTLPLASNIVYGLPEAQGGFLAALVNLLGVVGALSLPALTKKIGRKKLLVIIGLSTASGIFFSWFLAPLTLLALWIGVIIAGIGGGALPAILLEIPVLMSSVNSDPIREEHVGGGAALVNVLLQIGGFAILPFIITPLINTYSYMLGYTFAAIFFGSISIFALKFEYPKDM
ncbi:MAG: MFS transporter [Candidatus Lokiarchaeota archaeon]|nr:MFS transporter [Candidatus Lokiarchaeota archaeon]